MTNEATPHEVGSSDQLGAWLPIETAPKDGTFVLLGGGTWGDDFHEQSARVMVGRYEASTWLVCAAEAGFSLFPYSNPTHWMPLPAPPQSA